MADAGTTRATRLADTTGKFLNIVPSVLGWGERILLIRLDQARASLEARVIPDGTAWVLGRSSSGDHHRRCAVHGETR